MLKLFQCLFTGGDKPSSEERKYTGDYAPRDRTRDSSKLFKEAFPSPREQVLAYLVGSLALTLCGALIVVGGYVAFDPFIQAMPPHMEAYPHLKQVAQKQGDGILLHRINAVLDSNLTLHVTEQIVFPTEKHAARSYLLRRLPAQNAFGPLDYTFQPLRIRNTPDELANLQLERELPIKMQKFGSFLRLGLGEDGRHFSSGVNELTFRYSLSGAFELNKAEKTANFDWAPFEEREIDTKNIELLIDNRSGYSLKRESSSALLYEIQKNRFGKEYESVSSNATGIFFTESCSAQYPAAIVCLQAKENLGLPSQRSIFLSASYSVVGNPDWEAAS